MDADLSVAINNLAVHLGTLAMSYPVTLSAKKFLEVDFMEKAPTFDLDINLETMVLNKDNEDKGNKGN